MAAQGVTAHQYATEALHEVRTADEAGFALCLVPEHHGSRTSIVAPLTLTAALLATTTRIRIGSGVVVLASHHPRHVAEQVTQLDQISGGRVVLGVGAGYQRGDLEPFGVPFGQRGARFEEALGEVARILGPEGDLSPRPIQTPRPPIWVGAWSKVGIARAARLADGWIADPMRTVEEVATMAHRYRDLSAERPGTVVVMREAWVRQPEQSDDQVAAAIMPVLRYYRRQGAAALPDTFAEAAPDRLVVGSAAECLAQVDDVVARTTADVVVLTLRHPGGPDHHATMRAIEALGAEQARAGAAP